MPTDPEFPVRDTREYPGFHKFAAYLDAVVARSGAKTVVDVGGGAYPNMSDSIIRQYGLDYTVLDIAQAELEKATGQHKRLCADIAAPVLPANAPVQSADIVFSHMVLEHVKDPLTAHRNVHTMLRSGGLAIHLFPSPCNFPLALNWMVPAPLSKTLVGLFQPGREHRYGKFPAYYRMCGVPSRGRARTLAALGYEVVEYSGYVGHDYYRRIPGLHYAERRLRGPLVRAGIPLISNILLVMRKL